MARRTSRKTGTGSASLHVECLEDRRLLSANGLGDLVSSILPVASEGPVELRAADQNIATSDSASVVSGPKQSEAPPRALDTFAQTLSAVFKEIENPTARATPLGPQTDQVLRLPARETLRSAETELLTELVTVVEDALGSLSGGRFEQAPSNGNGQGSGENGTSALVSSVGSVATHVVDTSVSLGNLEGKTGVVAKAVSAPVVSKAAEVVREKQDGVGSHAPVAAILAQNASQGPSAAGRVEATADADEDADLLDFLAAQARGAQTGANSDNGLGLDLSAGSFAADGAGLLEAAPGIVAPGVRGNGYQEVSGLRGLTFGLSAEDNGDGRPEDRFSLSAFADDDFTPIAGDSQVDLPEALADFSPESAPSVDLQLGHMLAQVGNLGQRLGASLTHGELTPWLFALATAGAAYVGVRKRRRRISAELGLAGAEDATLSMVPSWPGSVPIEDR